MLKILSFKHEHITSLVSRQAHREPNDLKF